MANFITNTDQKVQLKVRIEQLIQHASELKFLVGFFYFSGWTELVEALRQRNDLTLKVLVGLDIDCLLDQTLEVACAAEGASNADLTERFFASLAKALNTETLDTQAFYEQVEYFLELLECGRLQIKKTLQPNHAKLYFFKASPELEGWLPPGETGKFITGSSNLTRAGFQGQHEFNVEIGDYGTYEAEAYFDDLWSSAVDICGDENMRRMLTQLVRTRTQAAQPTPFEAYLLVLKTCLELMELKRVHPFITRLLEEHGYTHYQYQMDAVSQALSVIEQYNGVIIADVVGLGKSLIACMIARDLGKRGMVICPPGLMGDDHYQTGWKKYLADFELRKYEWEVFSSGDLQKAADYLQTPEGQGIEVVIVDEVHRFRNEDTQDYEWLSSICRNRTVILLSATPFNNSPADIFAMLKLFIVPGRSSLTLDEDLESRFSRYQADFRRLSYISRYSATLGEKQERAQRYYQEMFAQPLPVDLARVRARTAQMAAHIRAVLEPVLIRRNRIDLKNDPFYGAEVINLSEVHDPCELFFELSQPQMEFYERVVNTYFGAQGKFRGAIYQPFRYEKGLAQEGDLLDEEDNRSFQQQRNLFDFMRRLLVKRFESSFGAFSTSIQNFIHIHQVVLKFIETSGGRYILDRRLIEKIYQGNADEIQAALDAFAKRLEKEKRTPKHERVYMLADFAMADQFLSDIHADLTLLQSIKTELECLKLVENDSKAARLVAEVRSIMETPRKVDEPIRKVVIFSEYVDTILHIKPLFERVFPGRVLCAAGAFSASLERNVRLNFDASVKKKQQRDDFDILLSSDKLSEGVNLNRAGAIINYDIPWNPTRVIQRMGRINRIGNKVFDMLFIYNFFPTEKGSSIIKSREIASQKMFLIHATLGEDAKIFDIDEQPQAAELFRRINRNPEEDEEESLFTSMRREYFTIKAAQPELIEKITNFPARIKTAKASSGNQLVVFRKKGLGLFIQSVPDTQTSNPEVNPLLLDEGLTLIRCEQDEVRLPFSNHFWNAYETIKNFRETFRVPVNQNSLEAKAFNNLATALNAYAQQLQPWLPFLRTLLNDLRDYHTLPKFTLRRLTSVDLDNANSKVLNSFINELQVVRRYLGEDYLEVIQKRVSSMRSEIIIAVENQKK